MGLLLRALVLACLFGSTLLAAPSPVYGRASPPGDQLWVSRFDRAGNDLNPVIAISPTGAKVFVAGSLAGGGAGSTIAYDPVSGAELWVSHFPGSPAAITVSADGSRVYVTGGGLGYRTRAYDTATGSPLWTASLRVGYGDSATSLALTDDGLRLFVTGIIYSPSTGDDYATIAYDAMSGERMWVRRYNGSETFGHDDAMAVDASPKGELVFVTGSSEGMDDDDIATIAYEASTGSQRWLRRFDGSGELADLGYSLTASEDGRRVFVAGRTSLPGRASAYLTLAYNAGTGTPLWAKRYHGVVGGEDTAYAVVERGGTVYVTGGSESEQSDSDYVTISYDSAGKMLWLARYAGSEDLKDVALDMAISADGTGVFVTWYSQDDYATVAYDATSGHQRWVSIYDGPASEEDQPTSLVVSPDGVAVFVTGDSTGLDTVDVATVAYSA